MLELPKSELIRIFDAAQKALLNGDRYVAHQLLSHVVQAEPDNPVAWFYLAATIMDDPHRQCGCLQRSLQLDPDFEAAKEGLSILQTVAPVAA